MILREPTQNDLQRLYYELAHLDVRTVGERVSCHYKIPDSPEALLCLAAEMSRYDPRLFSSLVEYFYLHFTRHNPFILRQHILTMAEPQALLVIFTFVAQAHSDKEARYIYEYLARDFPTLPHQLFFRNIYKPGSALMWRAASESIDEFSQWGFLSRERPVVNKNGERLVLGHWSVESRLNVARRLVLRDGQLTLSSYLSAVEHSISRQQAIQDLKNSHQFKMTGAGRGSAWVRKNVGYERNV